MSVDEFFMHIENLHVLKSIEKGDPNFRSVVDDQLVEQRYAKQMQEKAGKL